MANRATQNPPSRLALKGIVFDLDGTLVDSLSTTFEAFNHGITTLGGRLHTPAEIMSYFGAGEDKIFEKIVGPDKAEKAYQLCIDYTNENLHRVPLHTGIGELLEKLKSAGVPLSICTGRSWNTTEMILRHHGLLDRFITVVADDHVSSPKPSPEGLRLALSKMKMDPSEILFVGDSIVDIQAARSAGSYGVAALWDLLADRTLLEAHAPHYWAEQADDIWRVWEGRAVRLTLSSVK